MMDIEAIKNESKEHSKNSKDWSIDALIKEFLWALHKYYTTPYYLATDAVPERVSIAHKELRNRVCALEKAEDQEKGLNLITSVMNAQMILMGKYPNKDKRNKYVFDLCYLLNARSIISPLMLP